MWHTTMLRKTLLIVLLALLMGFKQPQFASAGINVWTSSGPEGGDILALAVDPLTPTTLYAGTYGGVFKSTNAGASWSPANTGMPDSSIYALVIDPLMPSTLYAGTGGDVWKSTNGGEQWHPAGEGLPDTYKVRALVIDPLAPDTLYAGMEGWDDSDSGVWKSTTGGAHWSSASTGLTSTFVQALAIDP